MSLNHGEQHRRQQKVRRFGVVLVALVAASYAFRLLGDFELEHTSLVFIGIPALLAWIVASSAPPKTAMGSVMRTTTLALLISWIFLGEAFVCVLMAAPIFYLIGGFIGLAKLKSESRGRTGVMAILLLPLALEGTHPVLSTARERQVVVEGVVAAAMDDVRATLAATPRFDRDLPLLFTLGFPMPVQPSGDGLEPGDRRVIPFAHGGHHPGDLVLEVMESTPTRVRFAVVSDDSYITHWLSWREAVVELADVGDGRTHVRWTLRYARRLDPSWYFDPLENYGVTLAGQYLFSTLTTP
jgi:hypothetical protein